VPLRGDQPYSAGGRGTGLCASEPAADVVLLADPAKEDGRPPLPPPSCESGRLNSWEAEREFPLNLSSLGAALDVLYRSETRSLRKANDIADQATALPAQPK
jgi:hypothetical protein